MQLHYKCYYDLVFSKMITWDAEPPEGKNGLPCPALMNPADHYLKTINKDFEQENEEVCPIIEINITEAIDVLVTSYMDSDYRREMNRRVSDINLPVINRLIDEKSKAGIKRVIRRLLD
ncbi:hypothetical protein ZOSMA_124G00020 [Zostera marina]|uniref:Uncharacterized protein n=1 Tax=Zostera marina TaxID=29655 RepID=A0A0K9Q021_ZOSMR|nr:hypothetical protein ZOSMA_124G00020 [Zostera marina]